VKPRVAVVLATLLAAAGCSGGKEAKPKPELEASSIVVGFPNDLHGASAELSNGAKIAVREVNSSGGIGGKVRIRLLVRDTRGEPQRAAAVARGLIAQGARALVLPCAAASQRAIAQAARGRGVILLGTCDADPSLPLRTPLYWSAGMGANLEAAELAVYAQKQGYRRIAVTAADDELGRTLRRFLVEAAPVHSLQIVPLGAHPDAVVSVLSDRAAVRLLRRLRRRHEDEPVLGTSRLESARLRHARVADGTIFTTYGYPDPGYGTDVFYETYRSYYGHRPGTSASALGYVAIHVLDQAIDAADSTEPRLVAAAFHGLDLDSALGHVSYGRSGGRNPRVKVALVKVTDGRFVLIGKDAPRAVPHA
jgi:branched-chain amino acid transport system substrate-binding protein